MGFSVQITPMPVHLTASLVMGIHLEGKSPPYSGLFKPVNDAVVTPAVNTGLSEE